MQLNEIEAELISIVDRLRGLPVPVRDLDDVTALANAGEPGIALENLCTHLYEFDVPVPRRTIAALGRLGELMPSSPATGRSWPRAGSSWLD